MASRGWRGLSTVRGVTVQIVSVHDTTAAPSTSRPRADFSVLIRGILVNEIPRLAFAAAYCCSSTTVLATASTASPCQHTIHCWRSASYQNPTRNATHLAVGNGCVIVASDSKDHLQQVKGLEKQLFAKSDGWRGGMFDQELQKRNMYLLYATAPSSEQHSQGHSLPPTQQPLPDSQSHEPAVKVIGYLVMQVNSVTTHINKIAVAPDQRRRGVGEALLRAALSLAVRERRALCSTLHVDTANTAALGLYNKAGFKQDGLIEDYYGPGKAAYKLLADLQESTAVTEFLALQGC